MALTKGGPGRPSISVSIAVSPEPPAGSALARAVSASAVNRLHTTRGVTLPGGDPGRGDLLDGGDVVITELDVHGGDVLLQVGDPPGTRDRDDVHALGKHPGKGELAGRHALALGEGHDLVQHLQVLGEVLALETR